MAHAYPLHSDVNVTCLCCGAQHQFHFTSPSDQVVCTPCTHHLGDAKADRRDHEHVQLWSERYEQLREHSSRQESDALLSTARADSTILELRNQVEALTHAISGQFAESATGGIRSMLESDVTRRAERNIVLAEARTDRMTAVLWQLETLHRDTGKPGTCSCGIACAECAEWTAIEPQRTAIRTWETKNIALKAAGKRHALPVVDELPSSPLRSSDRRANDRRGAAAPERRKPR